MSAAPRSFAPFSLVILASLVLPQVSLAVPANEAVREIVQPDGDRLAARLRGDEWVHWYETTDGRLIARAADGFWRLADGVAIDDSPNEDTVQVRDSASSPFRYIPTPAELERGERLRRAAYRGGVADLTGTHDAVIILIDFTDTPASEGSAGPHNAAYFADPTTGLVLGSNQGKLHDYLDEVSYGQFDLQGIVANGGWHQSAQTEAFFGGDCSPGVGCDMGTDIMDADNCNVCIYELVREAVQLADAGGFDFAPYDQDADGVVDHLMVIHAGHNQAALAGVPDDIWSHRWAIPGAGQAVDGKVVKGYTLLSEHDAMSAFAHEFSHDLGAPDLYDYGGESDPVGRWCNMGHNFESERPPHLCGLLKVDIDADYDNGVTGWVVPSSVTTAGIYNVSRLDQAGSNVVLQTSPAFSGKEYFLIENRQRSGFYDNSVPESGLIFTHIDMDMPNGSGAFNDGPPLNTYHGAWVERPLGLVSPDQAAYSSDDGETQFGPGTIPDTDANGGVGTGFEFREIGAEGDVMSFRFRTGPTDVTGTTTGNTLWSLANSPYRVTGTLTVATGHTLTIEPGVVVKFNTSARLLVQGELLAEGTEQDSIVFTSYRDDLYGGDTNQNGPSVGSNGDWHHIVFEGSGVASSMNHCRVRYAGQFYSLGSYNYRTVSVWINGSGRQVTMTNCLVERTNGDVGSGHRPYAIYVESSGATLSLARSVVTKNEQWGVVSVGSLFVEHSDITDNPGGGISSSGAGSQVESCRILRNGGSYALYMSGATSRAVGCRISDNSGHGLYMDGTSPWVEADTVVTNGQHGIYCPQDPAEFKDNVSSANARFGYQVAARVVSDVWNKNTVGTNGVNQAIGVHAGTITSSTQWIDEHPYVVFGSIDVAASVTLSVEAGSVFRFNSNTRLRVLGELLTPGTESDPIVFTSYRDDEYGGDTNEDGPSAGSNGDWLHIAFEGSGVASSLSYCRVRYAGQFHGVGSYNYRYHGVWINGSGREVTMTNCVVERTNGDVGTGTYPYAVYVESSGAALSLANCDVSQNERWGVVASGALDVVACRIEDNPSGGVSCSAPGSSVTYSRIANNGGTGISASGAGFTAVADTLLDNGIHGLQITTTPSQFSGNVSSGNGRDEYVVPVNNVNDCWLANTTEQGGSIGAYAGSFSGATTWVDEYIYVPYGDLTIPHDISFTLEPGTILKFAQYYNLIVQGWLLADGTQSDQIVFTAHADDAYGGDTNDNGVSAGVPGDWGNVRFTNTNAGNSLQYCLFRYGGRLHGTGNNFRETVIADAGSDVAMTNCIVEYSGAGGGTDPHAIAAYDGSNLNLTNTEVRYNLGNGIFSAEETTLIQNCTATNNGGYGFYVDPELVGEAAQDNVASGGYYGNAIGVTAGPITIDDEWPADYTYVLNGTVTIQPGATLVPFKGAVIKVNGNYDLVVNGNFVAQGDAVDKIVLTSFKDDSYGGDTNVDGINTVPAPGNWGQIKFQSGSAGSDLGWTVIAYGGAGNDPVVQIDETGFDLSECIITYNLDEAIQVGAAGQLVLHNSDIYGNLGGVKNLHAGYTVDATSVWWGDPSGPSGVGPGSGDPVSTGILYDPWLDRSIDNPWIAMLSPTTSGNYTDLLFFDFNGDALLDLIGATEQSGIEIYPRVGFEEWMGESPATPISTGQVEVLEKGDFNGDDTNDLLAAGPFGIRVFAGNGAGGFSEADAPLVGLGVSDAKFAFLNLDAHLDIVACSGNNGGIWVFYGDGAGHWTTGVKPAATGSFNRVACDPRIGGPSGLDMHVDVVATSAEFGGIRIWYGSEAGTWTNAPAIGTGLSFFGLALGDIDRDTNGLTDIAAGAQSAAAAIDVYYNADGMGAWDRGTDPTSSGIYNDLVLAYLNDDTRLDLAAASQGGGINVWIQGFGNAWNYWYHPATSTIFNRLHIEDFTLNGSLDLAGAATINGIRLWDNQTPGVSSEFFVTDPDNLSFGQIAVGQCAYDQFKLTNSSSTDTLFAVFVYSTNPAFEVQFADGSGGPDLGPFDLLPSQSVDIEVSYCPVQAATETEIIVIHSSVTSTNVRVTGEGVPYIAPLWTMDLAVANAMGGEDNSANLTMGAGIGATPNFDPQTGEVCLPPLPPSQVFDARFDIQDCEGSLTNIHDYYLQQDSFVFRWQAGAGGYPITVSWDPNQLPEGTFLLSDIMGGAFVDTLDMADTSNVMITNEFVTALSVTTSRRSTFAYDLNAGWHLLSLAVDAEEEDSLSTLFPDAISAFTWNDGYTQVHRLNEGWGYWVNMGTASTPAHLGFQVATVQRNLTEGWSLVGAVWDTVAAADIQQVPEGAIQSIFGFDGSYIDVTTGVLLPGHGYWFDVNQDVEITIERTAARPAAAQDVAAQLGSNAAIRALSPYTAERATGQQDQETMNPWVLPVLVQGVGDPKSSRTLSIGLDARATEELDRDLGERRVPPTPPPTVFDARLHASAGFETYADFRPIGSDPQTFEIHWQAGAGGYPIVVSWDPNLIEKGTTAQITDGLDGQRIGSIDMSTIGQIVISEELAFIDRLRVTIQRDEPVLVPTSFALRQNAPNPFAQSTTIRFDLTSTGPVQLAVFEPSGRRVRLLRNEVLTPGAYSEVWDGHDESGRTVPSGVYFYRLVTGDREATRQLLLLNQ